LSRGFEIFENQHGRRGDTAQLPDLLGTKGAAAARNAIASCPHYAVTPLHSLPGAARRAGVAQVLYKDEALRFGLNSFKALGGAYAVACVIQQKVSAELDREVSLAELANGTCREITRRITVTCASDGNHGRAVAAAARVFGRGCTIFLHRGVSSGREQAIAAYGAAVVRTAGNYDDSVREAHSAADARGWILISDTAQAGDGRSMRIPLRVMQGYHVLTAEILDQLAFTQAPPPTHVFLQGGVGGLAAAVVAHFSDALPAGAVPRFIIVEPKKADCLLQSAKAGKPVSVPGDLDTLMAGLACGEVSLAAWPVLARRADYFMAIGDEAVASAMRMLADGSLGAHIVAGESAVAGLVALLSLSDAGSRGLVRLDADSRVLLIGTEGATDPEIYRRLVMENAL
jgi:diaminopropionate ammonia-lyase